MADDAFDISELKIKERPKPPAFGLWLSLLAIGLTLGTVRLFRSLLELGLAQETSSVLTIDWFAGIAVSTWALVNLILLIKRRRAFINSMIALLVVNVVLLLVFIVSVASATDGGGIAASLMLPVTGLAITSLWVLYLVRSQHVRQVFVR